MKYRKLTDINQEMTASENALQQADQAFLGELQKVAESIWQTAAERPVILLAGPSGSGKTTTAFLLERFLDRWGVETHTISMDNFFSTMTPQQRELSAKGKLDLESPARVDIPYLNQQLQKIIACEPTWLPRYEFPTTTRIDQDWQLTRKPSELLLLEGIHALNPEVITIPEEMTADLRQCADACDQWGNCAAPVTSAADAANAAGSELPASQRSRNSVHVRTRAGGGAQVYCPV